MLKLHNDCKLSSIKLALSSALLSLCLNLPAHSEEYDPNRDEQLLECDRVYDTGNLDQAISCYGPLRSDSSLLTAAEAYWALGETSKANEVFRQAVSEQPRNPHIRARWGRLFLSTHQPSLAAPLFREALLIDPDYLHAKTGLAAALLSQPGAEARKLLAEISSEHPDDVETLLMLARLQLETGNIDQADQILDHAIDSVEQQQLSPLDVYCLLYTSPSPRD